MTSIPDLPAKVTLASSLCPRQIADRAHRDRPVLLCNAHVLAIPPAQEPVPVAEAPRVHEGGAAPEGYSQMTSTLGQEGEGILCELRTDRGG